jgi:hypothetical protein
MSGFVICRLPFQQCRSRLEILRIYSESYTFLPKDRIDVYLYGVGCKLLRFANMHTPLLPGMLVLQLIAIDTLKSIERKFKLYRFPPPSSITVWKRQQTFPKHPLYVMAKARATVDRCWDEK